MTEGGPPPNDDTLKWIICFVNLVEPCQSVQEFQDCALEAVIRIANLMSSQSDEDKTTFEAMTYMDMFTDIEECL